MDRHRVALVVLVTAGLLATGCGSDDDKEPNSDSSRSEAARTENAKPKRKSVRAQMVKCIEDELGYDVASDDDRLSVDNPKGKLQAVIVIHSDAGAARSAVGKTLETGRNAVVFGRAEFIRHAADDTSAGVIANCLQLAYNRPGR
jgi:hypothetical protein